MSFDPTSEQDHILSLAKNTTDNLLLNAYAGCGKTSTLEMIERAVPTKPILYLCFNKKIADEASKRMLSTTTARTFNSLGHRIWASSLGSKKISLDPKKSATILRSIIDETPRRDQGPIWDSYWEVIHGVGLAKALGYVPEGKFPSARRLIGASSFHAALDEAPDDLTADLIDAVLTRSIAAAYAGNIDYNDQVYMPGLFGGTFPRFPLVLVDEAQDLNPVNHALLEKLIRHRAIFVGDPHQCHPPGTKVFITGKGDTPIEEVHCGMEVAYFSTKESRFIGCTTQGREIIDQHTSNFNGNLIVATVNNKTVKMTPNHKCIARINRDANGILLYLMRKGTKFRLGISRIREANNKIGSPFGPSLRARQEKADAIWLLDVYGNDIQARAHEAYYAAEFGIPTALFESERQQEIVDLLWELVDDNTDRAIEILKAFNRDINFPYWTDWHDGFVGFHRSGVVHATNLISKIMTMLTFPDGNWHPIDIAYEAYNGPVYGITVDKREESRRIYLANGILVHNSIYGFRGAVQGGMAKLAERFSTKSADLSVSFRCPRAVVEVARWRVPNFKWIKEGGHVESLRELVLSDVSDTATFICRNNAPLFNLAMRLLIAGRSVAVAGSDIGPKLVGIMRKLGPDDLNTNQVRGAIDDWLANKLDRGSTTAADLAECMKVFASHGSTLSTAIKYAEHLFAQKGTIRLMTIHKAKGLEFDTVYFLDPWLCRQGDEQDMNCYYVCQTRSMDSLYEINSRDIRW